LKIIQHNATKSFNLNHNVNGAMFY
jgi:hypothetical protein